MSNLLIYALWLQVFANIISVIVTFMIGRLKTAPSTQWFMFSISLAFALIYRLIRVALTIPSFDFVQNNKHAIILIGDMIVLPLVAIFIMIFVIQVYKIVKKRQM